MPHANQQLPQHPINYQILEEIWNHRRAMKLPDVGKKKDQKLTPQQIDDFRRVGKVSEEEAIQLLAEYNGHVI